MQKNINNKYNVYTMYKTPILRYIGQKQKLQKHRKIGQYTQKQIYVEKHWGSKQRGGDRRDSKVEE